MSKHVGSSFDDFLIEEDLLGEAEAAATKRVIAYHWKQRCKQQTQLYCRHGQARSSESE